MQLSVLRIRTLRSARSLLCCSRAWAFIEFRGGFFAQLAFENICRAVSFVLDNKRGCDFVGLQPADVFNGLLSRQVVGYRFVALGFRVKGHNDSELVSAIVFLLLCSVYFGGVECFDERLLVINIWVDFCSRFQDHIEKCDLLVEAL